MANIMDYLTWRGDLTFRISPFNEVDNLILAQLAYVDLDGIIPRKGTRQRILLKHAARIFFLKNPEEELKKSGTFFKEAPFMMKKMAQTCRFQNVELSDYEHVIDTASETQFCAFHVHLGDGTEYVAFQGTDDTLIGWKENFNMSFLMPVPAQKAASAYLRQTTGFFSGKLRLGGHSKGGNLAVYAAVHAPAGIRRKILAVYDNDGPGFDPSEIRTEEYQRMVPYIYKFVPEQSIIGMLLAHEKKFTIVKSTQNGIMQHDAMSWQVEGTEFVHASALAAESRRMNQTLDNWVNGIDKKQRREFVDTMFALLSASGAKTLTDINTGVFKSAAASLVSFTTMDPQSRSVLLKTFGALTEEYAKVHKKAGAEHLKSLYKRVILKADKTASSLQKKEKKADGNNSIMHT